MAKNKKNAMLGEKSLKVTADKELPANITSINFRSPWSLGLTFNYQCYFYLSAAFELDLTQYFYDRKIPTRCEKVQRILLGVFIPMNHCRFLMLRIY